MDSHLPSLSSPGRNRPGPPTTVRRRPGNGLSNPAAPGAPSPTSPSPGAGAGQTTGIHSFILLSFFTVVVLFGCLYGSLAPSLRLAPFDHDAQAFSPADAPSYFAYKTNVFNVFFAKLGWFWCSAGLLAFWLTFPVGWYVQRQQQQQKQTPQQPNETADTARRLAIQSGIRWLVITSAWIFTTQWFFGPALIDRSYSVTGGRCTGPDATIGGSFTELIGTTGSIAAAGTRRSCKEAGGRWRHGHDISGHIFLLTLGASMLALEVAPYVFAWLSAYSDSVAELAEISEDAAATASTSPTSPPPPPPPSLSPALGLTGAVVGLATWMILMTAIYFHTWAEKVSGLFVAGLVLVVVYGLGLPSQTAGSEQSLTATLRQSWLGTPGV